MSDRLEVPSQEEFEEEEFDDVVRRLIEVLNHEGFEYEIEDGFFHSAIEIEGKLFSLRLYLSETSFLQVRILLAGEPDNKLGELYPLSLQKMQKYMYGRVYIDEEYRVCLWDYAGLPVNTESLYDTFVRWFEEIFTTLGNFHHAYTAMEEGHTDEEVLKIIEGCIELMKLGYSPQTLQ